MSVQRMCSGEPGLVPAGLRGYRMWNLSGCDLTATNGDRPWPDGLLTAECHRGLSLFWGGRAVSTETRTHEAPVEDCTCGIYGWYRPDDTRLHHGQVFGVVEAAGRTMLGDFGFRAQHARVVALVAPEDAPDGFAPHWAARGVRVFTTREQLVAMFPPEDVTDLLGHPIPEDMPVDPWSLVMGGGSISFTLSAQAFDNAMRAFGQTVQQAGDSFTRLAKSLREADLMTVDLPDDPMQRALALRKRGNRGPEQRRRGRARLESI